MRQREREDGAESREIERAANRSASKSVSESEGASKSDSERGKEPAWSAYVRMCCGAWGDGLRMRSGPRPD